MLISMDHDCTPDCPICIPEEDFSKFVKERKIVPQSTPINHAMWLLYISYAFLTIALVGDAFWVASAIFGQDHQSHVASGRLAGGESSIGLSERLELIERLLKDIPLPPVESTNIMTAKEAGTSAIDDPNLGASLCRDNLESPPAASSSEKKPDAHARHPTGKDSLLHLIMGSLIITLIITWLAVRGRAQRLASSTLGGFSESKVSLSDNLDTTESLHSEDDEKNVQSEEVDYESRRDEESRAATMVQARYRGHLVRMSRPLVQLSEIAEIENRVKKLNELAGDSAFLHLLRRKEILAKLAVEEETMKLLLRLDNIQGSHPLVRQIRKSVAREIVSLEETFDALLSKTINTSKFEV